MARKTFVTPDRMRAMTWVNRLIRVFAASSAVLMVVACSSQQDSLCEIAISVPSFTTRFTQGLDNFSEDQYQQLRLEALDALTTVNLIAVGEDPPADASRLAVTINRFIAFMDDVEWDVTLALQSTDAVEAASVLGTSETLAQANVVDAAVIAQCGLPSTLPPVISAPATLPPPSIPSPTQTDPDATPPQEDSEATETGRTVAELFELTLTESELLCLGSALAEITDVSSGSANLAQYQGQFQRAFDSCNIKFAVPTK